jgi:hypothetical protein
LGFNAGLIIAAAEANKLLTDRWLNYPVAPNVAALA